MNRILLSSLLAAAVLPTACSRKTPSAETTAAAPTAEVTAAPDATTAEATATPQNTDGNRPGGGNFQQRAEERMQRMKTDVGLTDDQTTKIRAIYEAQLAPLRDQGSNTSMSREDRRAAFQKARDAANAQIEPLLTAEQKTKWDAFQQQQQQEMQNRRNGGGGNGGQGGGEGRKKRQQQ